jgi:hypothetical protein
MCDIWKLTSSGVEMWFTIVGVMCQNGSTQSKISLYTGDLVEKSVCAVAWYDDPSQPKWT